MYVLAAVLPNKEQKVHDCDAHPGGQRTLHRFSSAWHKNFISLLPFTSFYFCVYTVVAVPVPMNAGEDQ